MYLNGVLTQNMVDFRILSEPEITDIPVVIRNEKVSRTGFAEFLPEAFGVVIALQKSFKIFWCIEMSECVTKDLNSDVTQLRNVRFGQLPDRHYFLSS